MFNKNTCPLRIGFHYFFMHNFMNYFNKFKEHDFSYLKNTFFVITNLINMVDGGRKRGRIINWIIDWIYFSL